jgi:hypothetical protein
LNTFASNATFLIPKSKSSIATINQTPFTGTTTIVQKRKRKLTKMNLTTNKRNNKKIGFSKHTLAKTHLKKLKLAKKSIQNKSLNQTQCLC